MPRSRSPQPDALDLLKEDHDKVDKAFRQFEKMSRDDEDACAALVRSVCEDLKAHTTIEEEIFYPALREVVRDEELMNEAAVEHETAKMLIEQLENMQADDPNYHATFTVLGEYVRHHIEEEEGDMFPEARKSSLDLGALAEQMRARRQELVGEAEHAHA